MNIRSHTASRPTSSRSTSLRVASALGVAGVASGASQGAALATEVIADVAASYIPSQAVRGPLTATVSRLLYTPGIGLAAGVIGGLAVGWAASGSQSKIIQEEGFSWKKIASKPLVDLHNQGVELRERMAGAKSAASRSEAFHFGAQAGSTVGKSIGKAAGSIQGGLSGAALGWQLSGAASEALLSTLGEALPKELSPFVPAFIGLGCLVIGQMGGAVIGGALGGGIGWAVGSAAGGSYAALTRNHHS